jgi:hypothetical protein
MFNGIPREALLASLTPLTRNMWREYRSNLPWEVRVKGECLAVFNAKRDAIDFARRVQAEGLHPRILQP